jgi:uncharacterized YccA/Bax inhibitor family protein
VFSLEWINNDDRHAAVATASKEETNMQSNNPVFRNSEGFNGQATQNAYGNQTYPGAGQAYPGYGASDPSTWGTGAPTDTARFDPTRPSARMSIDSVVQKTAITLGVLVVAAAATWLLSGDPIAHTLRPADVEAANSAASTLYVLVLVGALGAFALSMVNSFKRVVSPALVIGFAALEGVALGGISKIYQQAFGDGVVTGAVVGTIAAFAGTLAAYKFFNIRVGDRFRKIVVASMFGFVGLAMLDMVLGFFGSSFGFNGFGPLGLIASFVGLLLGVLMLILDFDFIERGIAARLDERESWRAAFGLTVSLVWIYTNLLRILAIMRN